MDFCHRLIYWVFTLSHFWIGHAWILSGFLWTLMLWYQRSSEIKNEDNKAQSGEPV